MDVGELRGWRRVRTPLRTQRIWMVMWVIILLLVLLGYVFMLSTATSRFMMSLALATTLFFVLLYAALHVFVFLPLMKVDDFTRDFRVSRPQWDTSRDYEGHPLYLDFEREFPKIRRVRHDSTRKTTSVSYDLGGGPFERFTLVNWKGTNRFRVLMNREAVDTVSRELVSRIERFFDGY